MKKGMTIALLAAVLSGCADTKFIDGKEYDTYGLINKDANKNEKIEYRLVVGNIVWSILLVETVVAPIYFIGFSIYEPVGLATNAEKGVIH